MFKLIILILNLSYADQVHYNIAKIQADEGNVEFAITKYRQAIRLEYVLLYFIMDVSCVDNLKVLYIINLACQYHTLGS